MKKLLSSGPGSGITRGRCCSRFSRADLASGVLGWIKGEPFIEAGRSVLDRYPPGEER